MARRTDPQTSHDAAAAVTPATPNIRRQVEAFAFSKGERGFIDEELSAAFDASDSSSYRTRRKELTEAGTIVDSGRTQQNDGGRQCIVWVHRRFATMPPPQIIVPDKATKEAAQRHATTVQGWADQMRREGRVAAQQLQDAANFLRGLA